MCIVSTFGEPRPEIERKFRVIDPDISHFDRSDATEILQGYISVNPHRELRVRITPSGCTLTFKGPRIGSVRIEWETSIDADVAEEMLKIAGDYVVHKWRYPVIGVDGALWDVDEYIDRNDGLFIAEIELRSPDERFALLSGFDLMDVTEDDRFYARALAVRPYRTW